MHPATKKIKVFATEQTKARKQIVGIIREVHKNDLWKTYGYKSIQHYCREVLEFDDLELRSIMGEAGVIVTYVQMVDSSPAVQKRIDALVSWRRLKSIKQDVPTFMILSNQTLLAIAKQKPSSMENLAEISGIGERRLAAHGKEILKILEG